MYVSHRTQSSWLLGLWYVFARNFVRICKTFPRSYFYDFNFLINCLKKNTLIIPIIPLPILSHKITFNVEHKKTGIYIFYFIPPPRAGDWGNHFLNLWEKIWLKGKEEGKKEKSKKLYRESKCLSQTSKKTSHTTWT